MKTRVTFSNFEGDLANGRFKYVYLDGRVVGSIEAVIENDMSTSASRHVRYWVVGYDVEMDDEAHPLRLAKRDPNKPMFATLGEAQQAVRDSFAPKGRVKP